MGFRRKIKEKMMQYTPEESKRIYKVLLEEWEYSRKHSSLLDRIHLGGYQ